MKSHIVILCVLCVIATCKKSDKDKPSWAKKDIRDYNDADLERLLDQWDVRKYETSIKFSLSMTLHLKMVARRRTKTRYQQMNYQSI